MTIGRYFFILATAFFLTAGTYSSQGQVPSNSAYFNSPKNRWVDSIYNTLTDTQRVGQLFMVAAYSGGKDYNEEQIVQLIMAGQVGGLIFMQGTPEAQALQNNRFQSISRVPLLIGMDAEWGLGMRLTGVRDLPRQMMIGATRDTALAYQMGAAVAEQCKRLGVHINFAPVVDVNNNPNNPIINARSFGEDKEWVSRLAIAYMQGMQDNNVMACAKHFPGHGDTETDSHKDLPVISKTLKQLDTLEFYPFRKLINAGVKSVMVAHLEVPALEPTPRVPTTLSRNTITNVLKKQMNFKGLVFTDALNMQGVAKYYPPGEVDLKAYMAGNDVLLFSQNVPVAIAKILQAKAEGLITGAQLEESVKKILAAKYDAGLHNRQPVDIDNVTAAVNRPVPLMRSKMAEAAVTLVRDRNKILENITKDNKRVGYIGVNAHGNTILYNQLNEAIGDVKVAWLPKGSTDVVIKRTEEIMSNNDVTIVAIHGLSFYPSGGDYGLDARQIAFLKRLQNKKDVIIVNMGNAYLLKHLCNVSSAIVAYEDDSMTQTIVADVITGQIMANGTLPVTPCTGMKTEGSLIARKAIKPGMVSTDRLRKVDFVEDAGVTDPAALEKLSMFIARSIAARAFPGCRVLAAKNGKVFFDESFGYYDFNKQVAVDNNTIYDVASVTKVLSTTIAIMRLYETGKISLDKSLGDYLPWVKGSDKSALLLRDLLMHQAGLKSWIPFYKETVDEKNKPKPDLYSKSPNTRFGLEVARDLYLRNDYPDTVWKRILESPLENKGRYVYSDLDYYFLAAVAEHVTGQKIDKYVQEQFYGPMGLKRIAYNPLKKFKAAEIAPTELDIYFRQQLIRGHVHDQGAAMFGGVAGHAGIFATANDVAAIFQMLLNGGTYGGKRYFKKETVEKFTSYSSRISRRALGFDKPAAERDDAGPAGNRSTGFAFGHQGFTGTCAWADPGTGVVFVFLSNRVNPSAENSGINKLSVRTVAQDYIYEALGLPVVRNRSEIRRTEIATGK